VLCSTVSHKTTLGDFILKMIQLTNRSRHRLCAVSCRQVHARTARVTAHAAETNGYEHCLSGQETAGQPMDLQWTSLNHWLICYENCSSDHQRVSAGRVCGQLKLAQLLIRKPFKQEVNQVMHIQCHILSKNLIHNTEIMTAMVQ